MASYFAEKSSGIDSHVSLESVSTKDGDAAFIPGRSLTLGNPAEFYLSVIDVNRAEVIGEAFVEPSLRRRIVIFQKHRREIVGDSAPATWAPTDSGR